MLPRFGDNGFVKQETDPKRGAPIRCYHWAAPTASTSPSTTTVWWPMPDCSCRSLWPSIWVWVNWWTATLTWEMRRVRANPGDKLLTLVASALAGGDCIDDADVLRTGGTASAIGCVVKAPSTLGTFLRSFRWGHVRQLDRVSRELLARAWAAGGGPGMRR